jgi:hypothetical protein
MDFSTVYCHWEQKRFPQPLGGHDASGWQRSCLRAVSFLRVKRRHVAVNRAPLLIDMEVNTRAPCREKCRGHDSPCA